MLHKMQQFSRFEVEKRRPEIPFDATNQPKMWADVTKNCNWTKVALMLSQISLIAQQYQWKVQGTDA